MEIQEEAARLARTAVEANGFSDRIEVILGDAGNPKHRFRRQTLPDVFFPRSISEGIPVPEWIHKCFLSIANIVI